MLLSDQRNGLAALFDEYPRQEKTLSYGTAGFRDNVDCPLTSCFVKMGILSCLRSLAIDSFCIGVMITASHNPEEDNGLKLVDYHGGMLEQSWEPYCEELVNANNIDDFINCIEKIMKNEGIMNINSKSVILIGHDCRPHSTDLSSTVMKGCGLFGGLCIDIGKVTTPQLHYIVQDTNKLMLERPIEWLNVPGALENYYRTISYGYKELKKTVTGNKKAITSVVVDCSNGVGSIALGKMSEFISEILNIDIRNKVGDGKVNDKCGAELVQKTQSPPCGVNNNVDSEKLLASFDGDADRIVFHAYVDNAWELIDGDKIAVIFALFLSQELNAAQLQSTFSIGVVQTAYANGSSMNYLKNNNIQTVMAKTGVKYLHHKALEYDIGIYFEANGHGTVIFSKQFQDFFESEEYFEFYQKCEGRIKLALDRLGACLQVINQAVGDAISDMLFVLAALEVLDIDLHQWIELYTDLPSKQVKIPCKNKNLIKCSSDESRVSEPPKLQEELDIAMTSIDMGRCFIRPSGTEDVVRIYAEAGTKDDTELLTNMAIDILNKHINC